MRVSPVTPNATPDAARPHIDAERLAAWADHGLPAADAAEVELHLSQCDRCQEVLAAFVQSEPAPAAVIPFWTRRPVRWGAIGLAAAAALFLVVRTGREPARLAPEATVASREVAPEPQPVPPLATVAVVPPASSPAPAEVRRDRSATAAAERPAASNLADAAAAKEVTRKAESAQAKAAAPPPPPVAAAPPPVQVTAAAPVVTPVGAARSQAGAPLPAMAESVAVDTRGVIEIFAPDPAGLARRFSTGAGAAGRGGVAQSQVRQEIAPARWRIIAGMRVERSQDAGATWTVLPIEPALTSPLVAGSAASPSVCWLVGLEGVVLVTTDGRTFRRASLPEAVRLVGVIAEDGLRATVTTADGRKFSTVDGGLTWK